MTMNETIAIYTKLSINEKRQRTLKTITWFAPSWCNWRSIPYLRIQEVLGRPGRKHRIKQSPTGMTAAQAFFMITETGKRPRKVTSIRNLAKLIWAQRWMATQITAWKDGYREMTCLPNDFADEPSYIQELVRKRVFV